MEPVEVWMGSGAVVKINPETGKLVDPPPTLWQDIAYGMSNVSRFAGQVSRPYPVSQHSYNVKKLLPRGWGLLHKLYALVHDGSETLGFGDAHFRLKPHVWSPEGRSLETKVTHNLLELAAGYDIPVGQFQQIHDAVKFYDSLMGDFEAWTFLPQRPLWLEKRIRETDPSIMYKLVADCTLLDYERHVVQNLWLTEFHETRRS